MELNFLRVLVFVDGVKTGEPGEKPSEQGRELNQQQNNLGEARMGGTTLSKGRGCLLKNLN